MDCRAPRSTGSNETGLSGWSGRAPPTRARKRRRRGTSITVGCTAIQTGRFPVYTSPVPSHVRRMSFSTVAPTNAFPWTKPDAIHRRHLETSRRHCPGRSGAARPLPYGGKALGRVTFTADGRMTSVVPATDGRSCPAGVSREYSSYRGNYTYDGERLVTRVDAASDPTRIGSDQAVV